MTDAPNRPLPGQDGMHVTFCRMCEAFCGVRAKVENGAVAKILPDPDNPQSRGHLCIKGANAHAIAYDKDRLLYPMKRTGGPGEFARVSWEEALDGIAARWKDSIARHGPRSCGTYWGNPAAFSSTYYVANETLLKNIGVSRFFNAGSLDSNARCAASYISFGSTARMPIPDLPQCEFLIIVGANPLVSNGSVLTTPTMREDLDAIAARGRVIVLDPRRTETAQRYDHLPVRPGSDAFVLAAMVRQVARDGLVDAAFVDANTAGWHQLVEAVEPFSPEVAEEQSGVPAASIIDLARTFAQAKGAIYSRVGIGRARFSTTATFLVDALNIVTGRFGKPGGWVFGNSPFSDAPLPADYHREATRFGEVARIFGMTPTAIMADEIRTPGPDQIRSFAVIAGNPVLSGPGGGQLEAALDDLDIFFSIDFYINETNRFADYILPATTFLERADIPVLGMSHMPRPYVQYSDAVIPPQGESHTEVDILSALAARLDGMEAAGDGGAVPERPEFMDMLDGALRAAGWPSIADLKAAPHGVMMGELSRTDWQAKLTHADGKLHLWHDMLAEDFARMQLSQSDADLRLFGRRDIRSINSWAHNIDRLVRSQSPNLLIHPSDARPRSIEDGARVTVEGPGGAIEVTAEYSEDIVAGSVCYPHGWGHTGGWRRAVAAGGANINEIVERGFGGADILSGVARLEGIAVKVCPA